ncbi:MAG: hypothetical protein AABN34_28660 [Acidobacteriota bacterium]
MPFELSFSRREQYSSLATGINLETTLRFGDLFINCDAKVDTGAEVCLFQRAIGEALDIPIENGVKKSLETLTGVLTAYGHEVVLEVLGLQIQTVVFFAESGDVRRNLLGRQGWLQLIRLGIVDYDSELHLSLYDE